MYIFYLALSCVSAIVMHIIAVCLRRNKVDYYYYYYYYYYYWRSEAVLVRPCLQHWRPILQCIQCLRRRVCVEHCQPGQFYSRDDEKCVSCPRNSYQPIAGQNFCIDCPGYTQTDIDGANSSLQCKGILTNSSLTTL